MQKIKKGDQVQVLAGKDKGKTGAVLAVLKPNSFQPKVLVEGLNMRKRHTKPNPQQEKAGGIRDQEAPLDISNVALVNPATGKADKVAIKILEDGRKVRVFKSNQEQVDI